MTSVSEAARPGQPARFVSPADIAEALGLPTPTREQADVIASAPEPALVVAGAGAGKTETMAARVVWLVANGLVTPDRVLGLTFTRKAARQLAERVRARLRRLAGSGLLDDLDPSGERRLAVASGEPTVLTYHAYAGRLLAEHGLRLPVQPGARILSETAAWQIAHRVVSSWDSDLDTDKVPTTITEHILALAGELGEHLVTPDRLREYTAWFCDLVESAPKTKRQGAKLPQELAKLVAAQRFRLQLLPLVEAYEKRKRAEGALDFADQMSLAARLAQSQPDVVAAERSRFGAVLLDEYQDTGHAQRVLLRALFGGGEPMPVTAVGDPAQAIYGWRGASAANLPRFTTDFPRRRAAEGNGDRQESPQGNLVPAREYGMLTSFRNPPEVLALANRVAEPLRASGLGVRELRARPDAGPADIRVALLPDVVSEREWVAERIAERWFAERDATGAAPTAAVLVRRRADMAPIAAALRERGLPVEVVGLGGLLDEPEVADLVATLRVLAEPLSGTAAARLLTGARWRLGAADLAALWSRARELSASGSSDTAVMSERAEQAGLVDALDDPGEPSRYSGEGYTRIRRLSGELGALRRRLDQPLPELVSDIERTMLLDIEALARPGAVGRAHLDAFAEVVHDYAESSPTATLLSFVDYLSTAARAEDGLTPGEVEVAPERVQVLTAHAAKGLEWRIVAVPHLVAGTFPNDRKTTSWLKTVTELPAALRGDAQDLPPLDLHGGEDRKQVMEALADHEERFKQRHDEEERRLCYVALTRSEHCLLASGHWWNDPMAANPKKPSPFLDEIAELIGQRPGTGVIERWTSEPGDNPLSETSREEVWPVDPLGRRRAAVDEGARLVLRELEALEAEDHQQGTAMPEATDVPAGQGGHDTAHSGVAAEEDDPDGWVADTDVLLAERARTRQPQAEVELPGKLSVSQLVDLAGQPDDLARRLRRPLPFAPNTYARRGTEFHGWLERRFSGDKLLDFDDLPGAADLDDDGDSADLEELKAAFERSPWAKRTPHDVEVAFSTNLDGITVRGRMDAVFADPDGGWTVVDWKTGALPDASRMQALAVQLAAYRLAWADLTDTPLAKVRAAFHYVRLNRTVRPVDLADADGLRSLLRTVPGQAQDGEPT
ncbi:ATP-dependent DNA helicase [Saccharomonospora xinjiangensis]|uniref:ATP-dependent helicase n=1 Tax=Saccharomonospora xinjiangensis TaxID=75294 RepID=UPI00106F8333|nr:ATP-dependent DNA helicase [Saccharomonospora xinjiangensis]QBQ59145.1 ATP-dependent DNA helicase PcrA [Saccharomonospora xinjiangensis]